ncbi:MAG: hypothetical protein DRJ31_07620 [Candidatus Methanomethylicota archaeon]|uniref:Nucleoside 2-deoxyribosyltransferase n=1 Tax=Thermoproteota archaeon TaxID=2056631 RepID=A0A497ENQ6_9CREN|nr:MAG: hypothetical protein DRJ31_07620 [Candidatus Verstraetearchaeota archaeon]
MRVFIAGPIQGWEEKQEYREKIAEKLKQYGRERGMEIEIVDPWKRERIVYRGGEIPRGDNFIEKDLKDIERSDVFVAYEPQLSAGTCMELYHAKRIAEIYTIVITSQDCKRLSPWIVYHADAMIKGIQDLDKPLDEFLKSIKHK